MSKRETQIEDAAEFEFEKPDGSIGYCRECFIEGAEWADKNPLVRPDCFEVHKNDQEIIVKQAKIIEDLILALKNATAPVNP